MRTKFLSAKPIKVTLNRKQLQRDVFVGGAPIISQQLRPIIDERIRDAQKQMVEEFEDHPVSQEIWAGNDASNTSGLLGGYGNLFSFIGFDAGDDPISPISFILRRTIPFSVKNLNGKGAFLISMNTPSQEEIYTEAQVAWMGGRSWLDGIERGIAGLNKYLYDEAGLDKSRSDTGIQSRNELRGVTQGRTKYVSQILSDFRKRLSRL